MGRKEDMDGLEEHRRVLFVLVCTQITLIG